MYHYPQLIESVVYDVLSTLKYDPAIERDLEEWEEEFDLYDVIHASVDTFIVGNYKHHLRILLEAETTPDEIDSGLWEGVTEWKKLLCSISFSVLLNDVTERLHEHLVGLKPMPEAGGVFPVTNDHQMWFGYTAPPVFEIDELQLGDHYYRMEVARSPDELCIHTQQRTRRGNREPAWPLVYFYGEISEQEPNDLATMVAGPRLTVKPKRVWLAQVGAKKVGVDTVQNVMGMLLSDNCIKVINNGQFQSTLSCLPIE